MSTLRKQILRGKLKTPVQVGFSQGDWDNALALIQQPSPEDLRLHSAAKFFGEQLHFLRTALNTHPVPPGSLTQRLRRAVGCANHAFVTTASAPMPEQTGINWAHKLLEFEIPLAGGVNHITPAAFNETVVDALRFELDQLRRTEAADTTLTGPTGVARLFERQNLSIFYHVLEEQWLDCLYHGWSVEEQQGGTILAPAAGVERAIDQAVGEYREHMLDQEILHGSRAYVQNLRGPLSGVVRDKDSYRVLTTSDPLATEIYFAQLLAADADLVPFMEKPADSSSELTIRETLTIWSALLPLAADLASRAPKYAAPTHVNQLEQYAPLQNLRSLAGALVRATALPLSKCRAALKLMKRESSRESIWHRPFIPMEDDDHALLVLAALRTQNLRRSIEYWLTQGGNDPAARGDVFERLVRQELVRGASENLLLKSAWISPDPVHPSDASIGDIDFLARMHDTFLVGEIKCLFRPASSHEWFKHEERVKEALEQITRKAAWVSQNLAAMAALSGRPIDVQTASVVPCVIVNSPRGALRTVDSVPIVDRYILERFFEQGYGVMYASSAEDDDGHEVAFYSDTMSAAANLRAFLRSPPHLAHYRDSVEWDGSLFPDFVNPSKGIVIINPKVRLNIPDSVITERRNDGG